MSRSDRILVAAGGSAVILAVAAVALLVMPPAGEAALPEATVQPLLGAASASHSPAAGASEPDGGPIVVDVEGAVAQPGIRELPPGSRIADAIAAAGGYATDADLAAAAADVNLAEPLSDGQQITIPRIGDAVAAPAASAPGAAAAGGGGGATGRLVNLNTATPEELEALPGIGAVTVQKIVAAREERPFASLEEAVERGVIHRGQLEDIQGVATAG